jgi:hypothetical protein
MRNRTWLIAMSAFVLGFVCIAVSPVAKAQSDGESPWWPSEWGPDDERGAANRITPMRVLVKLKGATGSPGNPIAVR